MTQTILPPLVAARPAPEPDPESELLLDPDRLAAPYAFDPVPRQKLRSNGITAEKQRRFIAYLAGCGSVTMAARAIAASTNALYQLRKAPGADSFAAAWEAAVADGARRVLDTLIDHAIHGTPERLLKDGEIILERRKYNTRAMMWIVQQRFPQEYGGSLNLSGARGSTPHGITALKEQWEREWREDLYKNRPTPEETNAEILRRIAILRRQREHHEAVAYLEDPAKRAAYDLLKGPTDWEEIAHIAARGQVRLEADEAEGNDDDDNDDYGEEDEED